MKYRTRAIDTNNLLFDPRKKFDAEVLSLGAGTQSTVMALLADQNHFGIKPDFAIFADTGWEPRAVKEHLWWLAHQLTYPVYIARNGNIRDDIVNKMTASSGDRFASLPYYTENGGMGRRQCTSEYKIVPIHREIRRQLGYKPRQHMKHSVRQWIGISTDEIVRMKESREAWSTHSWPLVEYNFSRDDCIQWFADNYPDRNLPESACIGCPFTNNDRWRRMKENQPEEFADACTVDRIIRRDGPLRGVKEKQYTHSSRIPLEEIDFSSTDTGNQWSFEFEVECEGICGV